MPNVTRVEPDDEARLNEVIAQCLEREDLGLPVDLERLKSDYPEFAEALSSFFDDAHFLQNVISSISESSAVYLSASPLVPPQGPPRNPSHGASSGDSEPDRGGSGKLVAARFEMIKQLGRGGMGAVFLAYDHQLKRNVALKFGNFAAEESQERLQRFQVEAQALAQLHHSNVCQVYDFGTHEDKPFIVMQYIDGMPLSRYISSTSLQPIRATAELVRKIALALQELHAKQIWHRDLKPLNIMVDRRHEPVIVDFGLARREEDPHLTKDGSRMGTRHYMSRAQIEGRINDIGPGADIHALGVIFYQLLTGRLPYVAGNDLELMLAISRGEPIPPSRICVDIDSKLEALCLRMMSGPESARFKDIQEVAAALTDYLASLNSQTAEAAALPGLPYPGAVSVSGATVCRRSTFAPPEEPGDLDELFSPPQSLRSTEFPLDSVPDTPLSVRQVASVPSGTRPTRLTLPRITIGLLALLLMLAGAIAVACVTIIIKRGDQTIAEVPVPNVADTSKKESALPAIETPIEDDRSVASASLPTTFLPYFEWRKEELRTDVQEHGRAAAFVRADPTLVASRSVAILDPSGVTVVDPYSGMNKTTIPAPSGKEVQFATVSEDGVVLAMVCGPMYQVWNISRSLQIQQQELDLLSPNVALTATGDVMAAQLNSGAIALIDTSTAQRTMVLQGVDEPVLGLAFSSDGTRLAAFSRNHSVVVFDTTNGTILSTLQHQSRITAIAVCPDGSKLAAADQDFHILIWDLSSGRTTGTLLGHGDRVTDLAFSSRGTHLVSASRDKSVRLWSLSAGRQEHTFHCEGKVESVDVSPDGHHLVAFVPDSGLRIWAAPTGFTLVEGEPGLASRFFPQGIPVAIDVSSTGSMIAAASKVADANGSHLQIAIHESVGCRVMHRLISKLERAKIRFSPDDTLLVALDGVSSFELWNVKTGERHHDFDGVGFGAIGIGQVRDFAFIDNRSIALATSEGCQVYSLERLELVELPNTLSANLMSVGADPDSRFFVVGDSFDFKVRVVDKTTGEVAAEADAITRGVGPIDVADDGGAFLARTGDAAEMHSISDSALHRLALFSPPPPRSQFTPALALSADGSRVLLSTADVGDAKVHLYSAAHPQSPDITFSGHAGEICGLGFFPDGSHAVSAAADGSVAIWRLPTAPKPDRAAAEWVLRRGGRVRIRGVSGPLDTVLEPGSKLPGDQFYCHEISLRDVDGIPSEEYGLLNGLEHLYELSIINVPVSDADISRIEALPRLKHLNLSLTQVGDAGLQSIGRLHNIERLGLESTRVSGAGVSHLIPLAGLRSLDLTGTDVQDEHVAFLTGFRSLECLDLDGTLVTDESLERLRAVPSLRNLDVRNTDVTESGLNNLTDSIKYLRVTR